MRHLFTWLLVFGILAGLSGRVLAAAQSEHFCSVKKECCGNCEKPATGDHQHDDKCPADHHHCGACLHSIPIGLEMPRAFRPGGPYFSLVQVRHESERTPDGPFSALDKPPLI